MAFPGLSNLSSNKNLVNGNRFKEMRIRENQEKISNECNIVNSIDCDETGVVNDVDNEEHEAYLDMLVEMKKRKNLEFVLTRLQKKKHKLDNQLKDLLHQQERERREYQLKTKRYNLNCSLPFGSYDREDSDDDDDDELDPCSRSNTNIVNSYADRDIISARVKELELLESKLREVELQMKNLTTRDINDDDLFVGSLNRDHHSMHRKRDKSHRKAYNGEQYQDNNNYSSLRMTHSENRNNALDGRKRKEDFIQLQKRSIEESNSRAHIANGVSDLINDNANDLILPELNTSPSEESSNGIDNYPFMRDPFLQSMQTSFDSLRNFLHTESLEQSFPLSQRQFFHLMLTQNYQILQQQQMLLLWFQQQTGPSNQSMYCRNCETSLGPSNSSPPPMPLWQTLHNYSANTGSNQACNSQVKHSPAQTTRVKEASEASLTKQKQVIRNSSSHNNNNSNNNNNNNSNNIYWENPNGNLRQNQLNSVDNNSARAGFGKCNVNLANISHQPKQTFNCKAKPLEAFLKESHRCQDSSNAKAPFHIVSRKTSYPSTHPKQAVRKIKNTLSNEAHYPRCQPPDVSVMTNEIKFISSDNSKFVANLMEQARAKLPNLSMPQAPKGAVGGESLMNQTDSEGTTPSNNSGNSWAHSIPLHIPPCTGAIRKIIRNPDVIESASKPDKKDDLTMLSYESIRPLMAAEGRSSELRPNLNNSPNMVSSINPQPTLFLLRQRPSTTGATSRDESISSSADDLAEADQTGTEIVEPDSIHSSNNINMGAMQAQSVPVCESNNNTTEPKVVHENGIVDSGEDHVSSSRSGEESHIRSSGDGEQGQ